MSSSPSDEIKYINPIYGYDKTLFGGSQRSSSPHPRRSRAVNSSTDSIVSHEEEGTDTKRRFRHLFKIKRSSSSSPEKKSSPSIQELLVKSKIDISVLNTIAESLKHLDEAEAHSAEQEVAEALTPQAAWDYFNIARHPSKFALAFYLSQARKKQVDPTISLLLKHEMTQSDVTTVLRGDTLFSQVWKLRFQPFINAQLETFLPEFLEDEKEFTEEEKTSFCKKHLLRIYQLEIPETLLEHIKTVQLFLETQFPAIEPIEKRSIVSGLLFLRLICPEIVLAKPSSKTVKLFCKVLQNIANEVTFGGKESDLEYLNPLIEMMHPIHLTFLALT